MPVYINSLLTIVLGYIDTSTTVCVVDYCNHPQSDNYINIYRTHPRIYVMLNYH